jgi:cytochrome P450
MQARDEEGLGMSDKQLRDEVVTLFLAGYETTAITLAWAWYALSQHRAIEVRLRTELKRVLQGGSPTVDDLSRLPYTEMIIKESLRLYPPAYVIGREALQACTIGGYAIPAGATLFISPWVLQRDPRYFEAPQEFRPERWAAEFEARLPRYVYLPFGGGPRICIGHRFAMMEAMLLLATIARRFRFTWQSDYPATPFPSITLRAQDRMWMKVVGHTALFD